MSEANEPKKPSSWRDRIDSWPEAKRQKVFKLSVAIIAIIVFLGWIPAFKVSLEKIMAQPKQPIFDEAENEKLQENINQMFERTQQDLAELEKRFDQLSNTTSTATSTPTETATTTPTTTPELTDEELKMLKEKVLEQLN